MAVTLVTVDEQQAVVQRLLNLARSINGVRVHAAGPEYTSLMACFLMHNMSAAGALLRLRDSSTSDWFPATVGYVIVRSMFETEITAHYITQDPVERSRQYIDFEHVLNKREMDACSEHRKSDNPQWRETMDFAWRQLWASKEGEINTKFQGVQHRFETIRKKGRRVAYRNWAGKSIRRMAIEVNHQEAYDVFYAEPSSYAHVDVRLANRFLRLGADGLRWSQRASTFDVGNVFRHAASFLTCFLELFSEQFGVWTKEDVHKCWSMKSV